MSKKEKTVGLLSQSTLKALLLISLAGAFTLFLYREALQLPLFFDDMVHLRWLDWHSLLGVWTTAEGLGYYRPLTMSFWKVGELLLGYHDPALYHFFNLFLHALNGSLTGLLAWRAYRGQGRFCYALLATLLFVSYPFSYQGVPSSSSLSKPLITTLMLASLLLYWQARRRSASSPRYRGLLGLSLFIALLAPFAYEVGVTLPLAIVGVEVIGYIRKEFKNISRLPLLYMLLMWGITLPLVILLGPKTGEKLSFVSLLSLWRNGAYFVEGLLFPITPIVTPLQELLQADWYVLLSLIDVIGLLGLLLFYRLARQSTLFWYALSWFVIGILPQWLMLDFGYVITSPRILYLSAVGSAMLWAGVPVLFWNKGSQKWPKEKSKTAGQPSPPRPPSLDPSPLSQSMSRGTRDQERGLGGEGGFRGVRLFPFGQKLFPKALASLTVIALLLFNVLYVRDKMRLATDIATPLWQAATLAKAEEVPAKLLYVNTPSWIAPKEVVYRVGTEGLTFIPEYVRVRDFVYVNTGLDHKIKAVIFEPTKQDWRAHLGYAGYRVEWEGLAEEIRETEKVYLTTYPPDGLRVLEVGGQQDSSPGMISPEVARFGQQLLLLEHQIERSDQEIGLTLSWYLAQVPEQDVTVFAHLYDEAGQLVTQQDGYPLAGMYPPRFWQVGDLVTDKRYFALPDDIIGKPYRIGIGWYDTSTGQRLPAFDAQNQPALNDTITVFDSNQPTK